LDLDGAPKVLVWFAGVADLREFTVGGEYVLVEEFGVADLETPGFCVRGLIYSWLDFACR